MIEDRYIAARICRVEVRRGSRTIAVSRLCRFNIAYVRIRTGCIAFRQTVFNEEAAQQLERLAELTAAKGGDGSVFRERGFKNAAGVLRRLGVQITNIQQLKV